MYRLLCPVRTPRAWNERLRVLLTSGPGPGLLLRGRWLRPRWLLARPSRPAPAGSCCNADIPSLWEAAATPPALPARGLSLHYSTFTQCLCRPELGTRATLETTALEPPGGAHGRLAGRGRRLPWNPVGTDGALDSSCEGTSDLHARGFLTRQRAAVPGAASASIFTLCLSQGRSPTENSGAGPAGARRGGPRPGVLQSGCVGRCTCV